MLFGLLLGVRKEQLKANFKNGLGLLLCGLLSLVGSQFLVASAHGSEPLTTASAKAEAVRLETTVNSHGETTFLGYDSEDRVVWAQRADVTWGYRLSANGSIVERVDEFGNRTIYQDSEGLTQRSHFRNHAGSWVERHYLDQSNGIFLDSVDPDAISLDDFFQMLGIEPGSQPGASTMRWIKEEDGTTTVIENEFARVTQWTANDNEDGQAPGLYQRQRSEILGTDLEVTVERQEVTTVEGLDVSYLLTDNHGLWQRKRYDAAGRLFEVEDEHGPIVRMKRDSEGRPAAVYLGHSVLLVYHYEPTAPRGGWSGKELIDMRDGSTLYYYENKFGQPPEEQVLRPRNGTKANLPDLGQVVDWDEQLWPEGMAVATLGGAPYALLPLSGEGPEWRSVALGGYSEPSWLWERLDYTDRTIVLHLALNGGGPDSAGQGIVLVFERVPSDNLLTGITPPQPTDVEFCNEGCICATYETDGGTFIDMTCQIGDTDCYETPPSNNGTGPRGGSTNVADNLRPLNDGQREKLEDAQDLALTRVTEGDPEFRQSCVDLFRDENGELGLTMHRPGFIIGQLTIYHNGQSTPRCRNGGIVAFTTPGNRRVALCQRFATLPLEQAAVRLFHEALHTAGLGENPPTPTEIDNMVRDACGF